MRKDVFNKTAISLGVLGMMILTTGCFGEFNQAVKEDLQIEDTGEEITKPSLTNTKEQPVKKEASETKTELQEKSKEESSSKSIKDPEEKEQLSEWDYKQQENNGENPKKVTVITKDGFLLDSEKPNRFILQYEENPSYFARIEVLGTTIDEEEIKANTEMALLFTGYTQDMSNEKEKHSFYQDAEFVLHVKGKTDSQNAVLKKINEEYVRVMMYYPNEEASEDIMSKILDILQTLQVQK